MEISTKPKSTSKILIILPILLLGTIGGVVLWRSLFPPTQPQVENIAQKILTVTALGYLEPQGKIIKLNAPSSSGGNSRVDQLQVNIGDAVKKGQIIAILDSRDRLAASLRESEEQVKIAQADLEVVKAGAKQGEIESQRATIDRLQAQRQGDLDVQTATINRLKAEVENAQVESQRYQFLYQEGATSDSLRDTKQLALATAQRSLQEAQAVLNRIQTTGSSELAEAKANLDRISEVRPVNIQASQAQVNKAIASVGYAQAQLDLAYVFAPIDGVVLDILTRPGELVSSNGIVELGQTQKMRAVLEVYETDIGKVKIGQNVKLFTDNSEKALTGKVVQVGVKVQRQNVVNSDTSKNIDARIVEVRVQLDSDSVKKVRKLTNLQVTGEIQQ